MYRTKLRWIAPALVLTLGLVGCDEGEPTTPDTPETSLTVLLTDAPGAVEAVWVEVIEMYLQGAEGRESLEYESSGLILLTELVGTTATLVEGAPLESGPYEQLRIVIGDAVLLAENGDIYVKGTPELPTLPDGFEDPGNYGELHCPSCSQSGIKVKLAGDDVALPEGEATMVLDFDVARSFGHAAGNSGKWIMHPVIHGVVEGGEEGPARTISGTVDFAVEAVGDAACPTWDMDLADFVPLATAVNLMDGDDPIVRSGNTDGILKTFSIGSLAADLYDLGQGELDLGTHILTFDTGVVPPQADLVANEMVEGVVYTINGWTCTEVTP